MICVSSFSFTLQDLDNAFWADIFDVLHIYMEPISSFALYAFANLKVHKPCAITLRSLKTVAWRKVTTWQKGIHLHACLFSLQLWRNRHTLPRTSHIRVGNKVPGRHCFYSAITFSQMPKIYFHRWGASCAAFLPVSSILPTVSEKTIGLPR